MGKVTVGVRRVATWALVTGAVVGAVGSLSGCMEVGPAVAPVGAGGPTVGGGDGDTSQDGVGGHHASVHHHPSDAPDGGASPSPGESAVRPSSGPTPVVPVPVGVRPPGTTPSAEPTTPPVQPSPQPTHRPSPSPPPVTTPPPSPSPTPVLPSGSPSAG